MSYPFLETAKLGATLRRRIGKWIQTPKVDVKKMRRLLVPLLPVLALLPGCAPAVRPATVVVPSDSLTATTTAIVIQNADGTITVKKDVLNGAPNSGGVKNGLVIPAQIIAPTVRTSNKPPDGTLVEDR